MARNSWKVCDDGELVTLFNKKLTAGEIAWALHKTTAQVYHRCNFLGLRFNARKDPANTYIKPPKPLGKIAERKCLKCAESFLSESIGNRICHGCSVTNQGYLGVVPC